MAIVLAFVFGVMLLGWLVAVLVFFVTVAVAIVSLVGRILARPGKFVPADSQFLHNIGIRL
jgi:hypothetical protein